MTPPFLSEEPSDASAACAPCLKPPNGTPEIAPLNVAVVTPIPTPYRDPFWNEFARLPGIRLSVFYCSAGKSDRPWTADWSREYRFEELPGRSLLGWRGPDASCFWNRTIGLRLADGAYDAILIGGYNHLTMWTAMRHAVRRRIPFFLMCESHDRVHRARWKERIKRPFLRWILEHAAGFLPTGALAADYLRRHGASDAVMTALPNVPDVERIQTTVENYRREDRFSAPREFAGRPVILFVGRLIPKKRAELVIRAFRELRGPTDPVLVILGDGPLRPALERLVDELSLRGRVHFGGFVQPDDVLRWLATASLFVLPSSETWGVAVVEALAAGVPVVVSSEVGCCIDVVTDPALGTVVPARSLTALRDALEDRLASPGSPDEFREAWDRLQPRLRYDVLARELDAGLRAAIADHSQSPERRTAGA